MGRFGRWFMGLFIAVLIVAAPYLYYRYEYTRYKRLRVVDPGLFYRSGSMTAPGFRDAIQKLHIRTVINVRDDCPEPELAEGYFTSGSIAERQLCKQMGVRYVWLAPDLVQRSKIQSERPKAIEQFLAVMDNPDNYPVLIHCRAGLHRTGCLTAIYRMEYNHWTMDQALAELKGHGFGEFVSTKANDYINQYLVHYQPGIRNKEKGKRKKEKEVQD